jgi:hypothetical protein
MNTFFLVVLSTILVHFSSFSQAYSAEHLKGVGTNVVQNEFSNKDMSFWVVPFDGSGSPTTRIPGNTHRYQRTEYIITQNEILTSGFTTGTTIDALGFHISEAGVGSQTGNLKIYLKNTSDNTYSLGTDWNIDGFTLVSNISSWEIPITLGLYTMPFSGGLPFTYTGGSVYVAWEFSNPSGTLGTTALSARCNSSMSESLRGSRDNSALPTFLGATSFRPATQFINFDLKDIVEITHIFTLEKVAVGYGSPCPVSVGVKNLSSESITFPLTISITNASNGTQRYTTTQTVSNLAAGSTTLVQFSGWVPSELEDVQVTASIAAVSDENWLENNTFSLLSNVNSDVLSYVYDHSNPTAFGYNHPNTGLFLSKYRMNGSGNVNGANIVIPNYASTPGNTVYAVVMNSAGAILSQSPNYVIQTSDLESTKTLLFPTPPSFQDEDFYVGLAQTAGTETWRPLGVFTENPRRENTYFTANLNGSALTELEAPFKYKFGIEAIVGGTLSISETQSNASIIYSNPVNTNLNLEVNASSTFQFTWTLLDMQGKIILSDENRVDLGMNKLTVSTEHLNAGMYILQTNLNGNISSFKIIKE